MFLLRFCSPSVRHLGPSHGHMAASKSSNPAPCLPALRHVQVSSLDPADIPVLRIKTDDDVQAWKHTRGYQNYGLFLRRLAESVVGHTLPYVDPEPDQVRLLAFALSFPPIRPT